MQDAKEEVRARLNIEDVIGEYVELKRAGRNFRGLSPFTGEKTPSFYVSPDKHIWHDFSSNKGGDIFGFIMEVEGLDFRAALELLARKAGVDLSLYDTKKSGEIAKKKRRLQAITSLALRYYQQTLIKNPRAVDYVFKKRRLSKQIVTEFGIGYAPTNGRALVSFLLSKKYSPAELHEAGVVNRYGGDLFRGRMMIPLMDATGQPIGFTGRIIDDEPSAPKYLNTPQTLLYDKSRHVFGLSQAKEAIRKADYVVLVEGNLDVISSHQAGIKQVVATAGTALTEQHLKALKRLTQHIRLSFDADKAGIAATERAIPIAQAVGVELSIISITGAKDPDELVKQDPKLWQQAIDTTKPVVEWILEQYKNRVDIGTAAGKRDYSTAALRVIKQLQDPVEAEYYLKQVATILETSLAAVKEKLQESEATKAAPKRIVHATTSHEVRDTSHVYQDDLLAVCLIDPAARDLLHGSTAQFAGEARQALVNYLKTTSQGEVDDTPKSLQKYDEYVKIVLLRAEARYNAWSERDRYYEVAKLLRQVEAEHVKQQKEQLTGQLRDAEAVGDDVAAQKLREQINNLIKEMLHVKK